MPVPYQYPGLDPFLPPGTDHEVGRLAITNPTVAAASWQAAQLAGLSSQGHDAAALTIVPALEKHRTVLATALALLDGVLASIGAHYEPPAPAAPAKPARKSS